MGIGGKRGGRGLEEKSRQGMGMQSPDAWLLTGLAAGALWLGRAGAVGLADYARI